MDATLLIASPQMKDAFFERAVVLLWHHDEEGAVGVVVNRLIEHGLSDVLAPIDGVDLDANTAARVGWGGPVEQESGTVVTTGHIDADEGWILPTGLHVTRSQDALMRLLADDVPLLLCLGYAGWGPGQLDTEIADGGWLYCEPDHALLFQGDPETLYERALATLGLSPETVWMSPIDA